ncbi:MAG: hypothetical protein KA803_11435 [Rhodoferax sp.]|nr:hypothetical protein [Rhodoferax sp.]
MHEVNEEQAPERLSIPLRSGRSSTEQELTRYSFDLILFPRYLEDNMAERVSVKIYTGKGREGDVMALYEDAQSNPHPLVAQLKADEQGVLTDSDDLYRAIHSAFEAHAGDSRYIGFTRYGRPPYAPLFALAILYQKYGRGLYKAGDMLPTPWPALSPSYRFKV